MKRLFLVMVSFSMVQVACGMERNTQAEEALLKKLLQHPRALADDRELLDSAQAMAMKVLKMKVVDLADAKNPAMRALKLQKMVEFDHVLDLLKGHISERERLAERRKDPYAYRMSEWDVRMLAEEERVSRDNNARQREQRDYEISLQKYHAQRETQQRQQEAQLYREAERAVIMGDVAGMIRVLDFKLLTPNMIESLSSFACEKEQYEIVQLLFSFTEEPAQTRHNSFLYQQDAKPASVQFNSTGNSNN